MSRRSRECCCGFGPVAGAYAGAGCGGFDPCRLALFLLILKKACIIDAESATILIFLFLLCCKGFGSRGICAC
ncbi:hypothetical protein CLHOM_30910 [Clostridium homopropionicum DSM 5847]|uniref:Uncharacterized protein n=1 Tax=Clostridium homopropionicum DSM 5847 TaxID=1121318 RepID=A0A0L6Z5Z3_9CLOT|nr:hypothetical protein [Clostridium homopropionicum]KOA18213.1 hypothetical protein CLHOM_30910 [Clostridium homopropionicum DSM 5847]SFF71178.1 hypothetical protein SAMN04488501_101390 [Clostridium homopropionicum]